MNIEFSELSNYFFDISNIFATEQTSGEKTMFITPRPRPTDAFLLLLTTTGICYQENEPPFTLTPGSMLYMPQNSHYMTETSPAINGCIQKNLLFEFTLNHAEIKHSYSDSKHTLSRDGAPGERIFFGNKLRVVLTHNSEVFQRLFYSLIEETHSSDSSLLRTYRIAYEIFDVMSENCRIKPVNNASAELIKNSLKYLEDDSQKSKSIKDISELCNMSIGYYERLFRSCIGISPIEYKNIHKINKIKMLLQSTDISLNELSEKVGCCDCGYLCRFFKRKTGMTPLEYRRIYR